jgi:hypothetical protein
MMRLLIRSLPAVLAAGVLAVQPWLDTSLSYEERLLAFVAQLNDTQKYNMVQGDTEACTTCILPHVRLQSNRS